MKKIIAFLSVAAVLAFGLNACKDKNPPLPASCPPQKSEFLVNGHTSWYKPIGGRTYDTALIFEYQEITPRVFRVRQKFTADKPTNLPKPNDTTVFTDFMQVCGANVTRARLATGIEGNFTRANFFIPAIRAVNDKWNFTQDSVKYYMGCAEKYIIYSDPPYFGDINSYRLSTVVDKIYMRSVPDPLAPADTILWSDRYGILRRYHPTDLSRQLRMMYFRD
jgi:hypothetical protein